MRSPVGSLKFNISEWHNINANAEVINWIENGVTLPFKTIPEPYQCVNHQLTTAQSDFVDKEIQKVKKTPVDVQRQARPFLETPYYEIKQFCRFFFLVWSNVCVTVSNKVEIFQFV